MRVIAEIGNANGDLRYVLDAVDQFADAGVWAIKGQMYRADTLVTRTAKPYGNRIKEPATQWEAFSKQLSRYDWAKVHEACEEKGVLFFGSVFDLEAIDLAVFDNWPYIKLASADITYRGLIEAAAYTGIPLIMSTGAATSTEIGRAIKWAQHAYHDVEVTLMVCTLSYPTLHRDANLARIETMRRLFTHPVGYSDHTRDIDVTTRALQHWDAWCVEKHVTLTPNAGGDHDFAATPSDIRLLMEGKATTDNVAVDGSPVIRILDCELAARSQARRSLHASRDLRAGEQLTIDNVKIVRPGDGIDPWLHLDMLGMCVTQPVAADAPITRDLVTE